MCIRDRIKVGRFGAEDDAARVRLARRVIGGDRLLMVDANNAYGLREAMSFAEVLADEGVTFFEEPIPFGDPEVSAELRARSRVPIAGYELETSHAALEPYITARAVDVIQPDAVWCGGIGEAIAVASAAERRGIAVVPHNFSSFVALGANYQVVCSTERSDLLEYDCTGCPFIDEIAGCASPYVAADGSIAPSELPGLGVELDHVALTEL